MEARARDDIDTPRVLLTKEEQATLLDLVSELSTPKKNINPLKLLLSDLDTFFVRIESRRMGVVAPADNMDPAVLLLKFLSLSETDRQELLAGFKRIARLYNPAGSRSAINIDQVTTYNAQVETLLESYATFKNSELRLDLLLHLLLQLPNKKQIQLLAAIESSTLPEVLHIIERLERKQLQDAIEELRSTKNPHNIKGALNKCNKVLEAINLRLGEKNDEKDFSYAMLLGFLSYTDSQVQTLLDALARLCCIVDFSSPESKAAAIAQIATFNALKVAPLSRDTQALFQPHMQLNEIEREHLLAIIINLCNDENSKYIISKIDKFEKLLKKVRNKSDLEKIKKLYESIISTLEPLDELADYAKNQGVFIDESLDKKIVKLTAKKAELDSKFQERFQTTRDEDHAYIKKIGETRKEEEKPVSAPVLTPTKSSKKKGIDYSDPTLKKDRLFKIRMSAIFALLENDILLHILENQITSLDFSEFTAYLSSVRVLIKEAKSEAELLKLTDDHLMWKNSHPVLKRIAYAYPLLGTINTMLSRINAYNRSCDDDKEKLHLENYPAFTKNSSRVKQMMPRSNPLMAVIYDVLKLTDEFKRRLKTLELEKSVKDKKPSPKRLEHERTRSRSSAPKPNVLESEMKNAASQSSIVPPLALPSPDVIAVLSESHEPRHRGHERRIQYQDMRGISLAILPTLFIPRRTSDASTSARTQSSREREEKKEGSATPRLTPKK